MKLTDITAVYRKNDPLNKTNHQPVSVLPVVSKVFIRLMQKQFSCSIVNYFSPYSRAYKKGFSMQWPLLTAVEKQEKKLRQESLQDAILMDLFKAFDTLNNNFLIAKLHPYSYSSQHDVLKTFP